MITGPREGTPSRGPTPGQRAGHERTASTQWDDDATLVAEPPRRRSRRPGDAPRKAMTDPLGDLETVGLALLFGCRGGALSTTHGGIVPEQMNPVSTACQLQRYERTVGALKAPWPHSRKKAQAS